MKIGLITIHYANSYGGLLQAYAAQYSLSKYGEVEIIDYKTDHLEKSMQLIRYKDGPRSVLRIAKDVFRIIPRFRALNLFKKFINSNFYLSDPCRDHESFIRVASKYNYVVSGSDQIWNPKIIAGLDSIYFLDGDIDGKKIAFASSMGEYRYSIEESQKVKGYLEKFKKIAVREEDTAKYLSNLTGRSDIEQVLDPTLLMNLDEWSKLKAKEFVIPSVPYVLVYTLKKNPSTKKIITKLIESLDLFVVAIDQDPFLGYSSNLHLNDIGPSEFLSLFLGASFVITNSFHGTAFAINFSKPFVSIEPESGKNRILDLLGNVNLESRFISTKISAANDFNRHHHHVDWNDVQVKLNTLRASSFGYLSRAFTD